MTKLSNRWLTRIGIVTLVMVVAIFGLVRTVQAQGIDAGESVPAGKVIENDAFLSGDDIVVEGKIDGDVLAIGRQVTVSGVISGSLIVLAEQVDVSGEVGGSIYSTGLRLTITSPASVAHSLYFIGSRLVTEAGTTIGRDQSVFSLGAQLSGTVDRDTNAHIGLELFNWIGQTLDINGGEPIFRFRTSDESAGLISPRVQNVKRTTLVKSGQPTLLSTIDMANPIHFAPPQQDGGDVSTADIGNWFIDRATLFVSLLIVGGLAAWLRPALFTSWIQQARQRTLAASGYGLVTLVSGYVGIGLLAFLVLAVGLGLRFLTLRMLAFTTMGVGFSALALAFWLLFLFTLFVSKAIVAYLGGLLILERLVPRATGRTIWPLLLGLLIYVFLRAIPYLGWGIGLVVTLIGLGAVWMAYRQKPAMVPAGLGEEE